jgi:hypothetical protein
VALIKTANNRKIITVRRRERDGAGKKNDFFGKPGQRVLQLLFGCTQSAQKFQQRGDGDGMLAVVE